MNRQTYCTIIQPLLASALWGKEIEIPNGVDWAAIYEEMHSQTIAMLVGDTLRQLNGMDQGLYGKWKNEVMKQVYFFHKYMYAQDQIIQLLLQKKINFVILKGSISASSYPVPSYRVMGDIDLMVRPDDVQKVCICFQENECIQSVKEPKESRHKLFEIDGIIIEVHDKFDKPEKGYEAKLDQHIYNGIDRYEICEVDGYKIPRLPKLENGLVLLQHIRQHLKSGLGFRQIIDWMMYVQKHMDNQFWMESFKPAAVRLGLYTLAISVTRMCQLYLGLDEKQNTWCRCADEKVCGELVEYIIMSGNMGSKLNWSQSAENHLSDLKLFLSVIKNLQRHGIENWRAADTYPWLRPFAWIYQIIHLLLFSIKNGLSFKRRNQRARLWKKFRT